MKSLKNKIFTILILIIDLEIKMESGQPCCPLSPERIRSLLKSRVSIDLSVLLEIEKHVSSTDLDCPHAQLKDLNLSEPLEGSSLLLLACDRGNLESVKRMVGNWGVHAGTTAAYYTPNKIKISEATPLFVAAYRGHIDVVKYLVRKGADVSVQTSYEKYYRLNGLTPLHASVSCPYGNSFFWSSKQEAMVKFLLESGSDPSALTKNGLPVWAMNGCGPDATSTLVKHGMSLTHRIPKTKETILHHWATRRWENSMDVVRLLVERGADLQARDCRGLTPIFPAAAQGFFHSPHFSVFDFLLEREEIENKDKIDALELAGAVILGRTHLAHLTPQAFGYWRRAAHLRHLEANPIPKTPMVFKRVQRVEWTTLTQLEEIENSPSQRKIQSLLVQLRVFSGIYGWINVYFYVLVNMIQRLMIGDQGFLEAKDSFFIILEFILRYDRRKQFIWSTTVDVDKLLISLLKDNPLHLNSELLMTSLELIVDTDQSHLADADREGVDLLLHLKTLLKFVSILADHPELVNDEIMRLLHQLVIHDGRTQYGKNLLLLACKTPVGYNSLAIIRLLLAAGADPNCVDFSGNGPLLCLVSKIRDDAMIESIARLLLDSGTHLDRVNNQRKTAADFWLFVRNKKRRDQDPLGWMDLPEWCRENVPSLKCLSASAVRLNKIPYKTVLPVTLTLFTEIH